MIISLIKFGSAFNIEDSYEKEYLFFKELSYFRSYENDPTGRLDQREGNLSIEQIDNLTLIINGKKFHLHKIANKVSAQYQEYPEKIPGNICSLYMLQTNKKETNFEFDERLLPSDGKALLIYDISKLFTALDQSLKSSSFDFRRKPVIYYNPKSYKGDLTFFHKDQFYQFQNEYRILIKSDGNTFIKLPIPGLKNFSQILDHKTLNSLKAIME